MYIFIVNPVSGNGKAKRIYSKLMKHDLYKNLPHITYFTAYANHANEIANNISNSYTIDDIDVIIVIGGDGTFHEVLNGLTNKQLPIAFIAGGSGNDFARGVQILKNPYETMERIINGTVKTFWSSDYMINEEKRNQFANCIGFGFDAFVTENANKSRLKKFFNFLRLGTCNYLFAVMKQLFMYKPIKIDLHLDGKIVHVNRCFLMTVNNHPYFGGGMQINPEAKNNQTFISVLVVNDISKWKVLLLLLTVFKGKHTRFKEVRTYEASNVTVISKKPMPFQVDGETGWANECSIKKTKEHLNIRGTN